MNRNGHTNNVKKCDSISLSYGARDSIWVSPNVAGFYMMCENTNTAQSKVNWDWQNLIMLISWIHIFGRLSKIYGHVSKIWRHLDRIFSLFDTCVQCKTKKITGCYFFCVRLLRVLWLNSVIFHEKSTTSASILIRFYEQYVFL